MPRPDYNMLHGRLANADAYFGLALMQERWDLVADAIRIRCRIHCDAGDPEYAIWKGDK